MLRVGIIADDLTGANDTGIQFSKTGLQTIVIWEVERIKSIAHKVDVLVIDTESRGKSKKEAYQQVFETANALKDVGVTLFYKKIDSTLRGNLGAELDAVLDVINVRLALVVPAYPKNQRVTVGGHQLINSVPIERTEVAYDPITPVKNSCIPTLIRKQSQRKVGHIPLSVVMKGSDVVKSQILQQNLKGEEILVIDAATYEDLRIIATAANLLEEPPLLCGSAGLAEVVPRAFELTPKQSGVLILAGTQSSVTARQITRLTRDMATSVIEIQPQEILKGSEQRQREIINTCELAAKNLDQGNSVVIKVAQLTQTKENDKILENSRSREMLSNIILATFGEIALKLIDTKLKGLVLTGGDTAMSVLNTLASAGVHLLEEIEVGIPIVSLEGGKAAGMHVVTKAGAFGDELTLVRIVQRLRWKN